MVCTANTLHRTSCGSVCDDCGHLRPDRRARQSVSLKFELPDRRYSSNWVPSYEMAGAGGAAVPRRFRIDTTDLHPLMMVLLLVSFNLLDAFFTARALSMGFAESNPLLAGLFEVSLPLGMFMKSAIVGIGAYLLWRWRHHPAAMRGMMFATVAYGAVIVYHIYFQLMAG